MPVDSGPPPAPPIARRVARRILGGMRVLVVLPLLRRQERAASAAEPTRGPEGERDKMGRT